MERKEEQVPRPTQQQVNEDQVRSFFSYFDPQFRLNKILALKFVLQRRADFAAELAAYYRNPSTGDDQAIYHRFTNGVLHAAAAEYAMLLEDLFALLRFTRNAKFAKRIGYYDAGELTVWISGWEPPNVAPSTPPDAEKDYARQQKAAAAHADCVRRAFYLPTEAQVAAISVDAVAGYRKVASEFVHSLRRAIRDFNKWKFAYNQHKHGLKSALGWPGPLHEDALQRRRASVAGSIQTFDTAPLSDPRVLGRALQMPFTPEMAPVLREALDDRNYLRIYAEHDEISIDDFIRWAREITVLILCLRHNRLQIGSEHKLTAWELRFPTPPSDVDEQGLPPLHAQPMRIEIPPPAALTAFQLPELQAACTAKLKERRAQKAAAASGGHADV